MSSNLIPDIEHASALVQRLAARFPEDPVQFWLRHLDDDAAPSEDVLLHKVMERLQNGSRLN